MWRDCSSGTVYYVFHDGSVYAYSDPAVNDARFIITANNHGEFFNSGYRRSILGSLAFARVGSIPGSASLIYSDPPYPGTDPGPCPTFPIPVTYFNCDSITGGLIDQAAGNNLTSATGNPYDLVPGVQGNAIEAGSHGGVGSSFIRSNSFPQNIPPGSAFSLVFWWRLHPVTGGVSTFLPPYAEIAHPSFDCQVFALSGSALFQMETDLVTTGISPNFQDSNTYSIDASWHMVAFIFDPSNSRYSFKVDTMATEHYAYTPGTPVNDPSGNTLGVLARSSNAALGGGGTDIDEIGIWTSALDDSQLSYLWNGGSGRTWPF